MSDQQPDTQPAPAAEPPPHVRAIIGMIGTLAGIEKMSPDHAAKTGATIALDAACDLSPELKPLVEAIRATLNR